VRAVLNSPEYVDKAPASVYHELLDTGVYLASTSTMYRILREHDEVHERHRQAVHPARVKPELVAEGPNCVWSWDITKLHGPAKWTYFHLYVILDIYSRYVVGWLLAESESAALAEKLLADSIAKHGIDRDQLTIHADYGSSMASKPVAFLLADLGVTKTHSRPHTSNDNPFSEAQFRTLKYRPDFPDQVDSIQDARTFCQGFFGWYNTDHYHSGIGYHHPVDVHHGHAQAGRPRRRADRRLHPHPGTVRAQAPRTTRPANHRLDQQTRPHTPAGAASLDSMTPLNNLPQKSRHAAALTSNSWICAMNHSCYVEQFVVNALVLYAGSRERAPERGGTEVEVVLILVTGIDPHRPQRAQGLGVHRLTGHHDGIPGQPAVPDRGHHRASVVERDPDAPVLNRGVGRRVRVHLDQLEVRGCGHRSRRLPHDDHADHLTALTGQAGLSTLTESTTICRRRTGRAGEHKLPGATLRPPGHGRQAWARRAAGERSPTERNRGGHVGADRETDDAPGSLLDRLTSRFTTIPGHATTPGLRWRCSPGGVNHPGQPTDQADPLDPSPRAAGAPIGRAHCPEPPGGPQRSPIASSGADPRSPRTCRRCPRGQAACTARGRRQPAARRCARSSPVHGTFGPTSTCTTSSGTRVSDWSKIPTGDAEADAEIAAILARGGPVWIPADEANIEMDQMLAEAEAAEDARAFQEWDDLKASGQAVTIPHDKVRRQLGLPSRQTDASDPGEDN
jgi:putative transposase